MLAAPSKTNLPAHSRDVCPWGTTCPTHAQPTFADERRTATIKATKALRKARALRRCGKCGARRTVPSLSAYARGTGRRVLVCQNCVPDPTMARIPKWLLRENRQARAA